MGMDPQIGQAQKSQSHLSVELRYRDVRLFLIDCMCENSPVRFHLTAHIRPVLLTPSLDHRIAAALGPKAAGAPNKAR